MKPTKDEKELMMAIIGVLESSGLKTHVSASCLMSVFLHMLISKKVPRQYIFDDLNKAYESIFSKYQSKKQGE